MLKAMNVLTQKNIKITFLVVLLIKLFVLMIDLLFILFKGKDCIYKFIAWVLDEERWNKQIKKYFSYSVARTCE